MSRVTEVGRGGWWAKVWGRATGLALLCLLALAAPAATAHSTFTPTGSLAVAAKAMTTAVAAAPAPSQTNQTVTLTATVHGYPASTSGTVQFADTAGAIPGCLAQPITASGSDYTATCQTTFAAASSPEQLSATFTPASGSGLKSSSSPTVNLKINPGPTTTTAASVVAASASTVTYTATVTPALSGPVSPSGSVEFLDSGAPIAGCVKQALTAGPSSSLASCTIAFAGKVPTLSAKYSGDANFTSSTSAAQSVAAILATTNPATDVSATGAVLNGYIYTGGAAVSWQFQYGRGTSYGTDTPAQTIAAGQGPTQVSWPLAKLSPGQSYHYQLVVAAVSGAGSAVISLGGDANFQTAAGGRLLLTAHRLRVIHRRVSVSQRCSSPVACDGRFTITTHARKGKKRRRAVLCTSSRFKINAGKRKSVSSKLKSHCLALLRKAPHHRMSATLTSQPSSGQRGVSSKITLILK